MERRRGKTFAPGGPRRKKKAAKKKATHKKVARKKAARKGTRRKPRNPKVHDVDHVDEIDSLLTLQNRVGDIFEKSMDVGNDLLEEVTVEIGKLRDGLEKKVVDLLRGIEDALCDLQNDVETRRENAAKKKEDEEEAAFVEKEAEKGDEDR